MRLLAKAASASGLEEGAVVRGYLVEDSTCIRTGEVLHRVRAPDGGDASLVAAPRPFADRHERAHFRRLASVRSKLEDPGLLPVRDFGEHAGRGYLIADSYPAFTLADLLDDGAQIPPDVLLALLDPVSRALDLAHGHGLVHQALTSESLLGGAERLQLDAFGLASLPERSDWGIESVGDSRYRSPEDVRGEPIGPAANLYSLAAVIVHALTGMPPYIGEPLAVAVAHLTEPPPRVSEHVPGLGEAVDDVIRWAMAKDPSQRPGSAAELMQAFEQALDGVAPAVRPSPLPSAEHRRGLRGRAGVAAVLAGAATVGVLAAAIVDPFGGAQPSQPSQDPQVRVLKRLDTRRAALRDQLTTAELPREQADVARELATAYRDVARAARSRSLVTAARSADSAYSELAAASEQGGAGQFATAAEAVTRAEQQLAAAAARPG